MEKFLNKIIKRLKEFSFTQIIVVFLVTFLIIVIFNGFLAAVNYVPDSVLKDRISNELPLQSTTQYTSVQSLSVYNDEGEIIIYSNYQNYEQSLNDLNKLAREWNMDVNRIKDIAKIEYMNSPKDLKEYEEVNQEVKSLTSEDHIYESEISPDPSEIVE